MLKPKRGSNSDLRFSKTRHTNVLNHKVNLDKVTTSVKAMANNNDPNYKKYLEIRKRNLHKMNPIPVCKFDNE